MYIILIVIAIIITLAIIIFIRNKYNDNKPIIRVIKVNDVESMEYIDNELNIHIVIKGTNWYHEKEDTMVIFHDDNKGRENASFAISSSPVPTKEDVQNKLTDVYMSRVQSNHENDSLNYNAYQLSNLEFGDYVAYRYYYSSYYKPFEKNIAGKYLYWWVQDVQYTCSLICEEEHYDYYANIIEKMFQSFTPANSLN